MTAHKAGFSPGGGEQCHAGGVGVRQKTPTHFFGGFLRSSCLPWLQVLSRMLSAHSNIWQRGKAPHL